MKEFSPAKINLVFRMEGYSLGGEIAANPSIAKLIFVRLQTLKDDLI